jgi:hypothetical protein
VVPSTLLGLVVLAASIGPGYIWIAVAETRIPRRPRSQLLEIAEMVIVGGLASALAFLAVFSFASWTSLIDADALAKDGTAYLLGHPTRGLGVVFLGLALAYLGAWGVALLRYRKHPQIIEHGYSAWHRMLGQQPGRDVYATVDLRDGTTVAGWVFLCTVDEVPPSERDLVLIAARGERVKMRPPHSEAFVDSRDRAVIVNGADVLALTASYFRHLRSGR